MMLMHSHPIEDAPVQKNEPEHDKTNHENDICAQRRLRSDWALESWLPIEGKVKTLIRLGGCPG